MDVNRPSSSGIAFPNDIKTRPSPAAKRDYFSTPERIILCRHGERFDHANPTWSRTATRPHDPPLTEDGRKMAKKLGEYLKAVRFIDPANVVVFSSPLQRCVQTAHHILEGLCCDDAKLLKHMKIFVEETLVEGSYWMNKDLKKNRQIRLQEATPLPVYHNRESLAQHVSPLVQPKPFVDGGFGAVNIQWNPVLSELVEEIDISQRCLNAAHECARCPGLVGKILVLVSHGQASVEWYNALSFKSLQMTPPYTAFAELCPAVVDINEDAKGHMMVVWHPQMEPFSTPHTE